MLTSWFVFVRINYKDLKKLLTYLLTCLLTYLASTNYPTKEMFAASTAIERTTPDYSATDRLKKLLHR